MNNVVNINFRELEAELRGGGEPPDNGAMDARITKLEAILPNLATKLDLADFRAEMHKEFTAQTWRIIGAMFTLGGVLCAATFFIARNIH